jgi:quercetin dioxygenase-like cupin family protein
VLKTIAMAGLVGASLLVPVAAGAKDSGKAVFTPAGDLKWSDIPNRPGFQMAPVQGDPSKGAARFFVKFPGNAEVPLHHHTADHYVAVISGTIVLNDGQDHTLPAGSYFSFTGKRQHTTKCTDTAGCTVFVDAKGKWDVVEAKTAKK